MERQMKIKPIETVYHGLRFRSRLEAKWAVFFDEIGINYHYEPDGFDLGDEWYLPDFYLDDFGIYAEIKPFDKSVVEYVGDGNAWERKCEKFRDCTDHAILLCYDDPGAGCFQHLFAWDMTDGSAGCSDYDCNFYYIDKPLLIVYDKRYDRDIYLSEDFSKWSEHILTITRACELYPRHFADIAQAEVMNSQYNYFLYQNGDPLSKLAAAQLKARQARFEHNETPKFKEVANNGKV